MIWLIIGQYKLAENLNRLSRPITRCFSQRENDLLPLLCLISPPNGSHRRRSGGSTCHICGNTSLRDRYMLKLNKQALGNATQSRTALALFAATVLIGGSATEASARSHRHHHHRHHHFHHVAHSSVPSSAWR